MPLTPEQTELGNHRMWDRAQIKPDKIAQARKIARAIIANRAAYAAVERATGVPWFMIGALHCRESDMNFSTHLHNGDSPQAAHLSRPRRQAEAGPPAVSVVRESDRRAHHGAARARPGESLVGRAHPL